MKLGHGMLDILRLHQIANIINTRQLIIKLVLSNETLHLYIHSTSKSTSNIEEFCKKNHFSIEKTEDSILMKTIYLKQI